MVTGTRKAGERRSTRQQQRPMLAWMGVSAAWIFLLASASSGVLETDVVHAFSSTTKPAATTTMTHPSRRTTALETKHDKCDAERTVPRKTNKDPWTNLLVAAAFVTATLGDGMLANALVEDPSTSSTTDAAVTAAKTAATPPATAATKLELVSPGSPIIETKIVHGDAQVLVQSTEKAVKNLAKTALLERENRAALSESVQRLRTSVQTELSSVQAWQQVIGVFREYGIDLQQETDVVIRPPADLRRTYDDFVTKQQVNLLLNGEILQITLHYEKGSNNGLSLDEGGVVQPDDEWTLRVRGYKGFDPNALDLLDPIPRQDYTPQWIKRWNNYWKSPLENTDTFAKLFGADRTHGDAIVVEGAAAIALSYAVSYAYYVNENEKAEEEARQKKAKLAEGAKKKKEAAAAAAKVEDTAKTAPPAEKKKVAPKPKKPPAPAKQTSTVEAPQPRMVETSKEPVAKPTVSAATVEIPKERKPAVEKTNNQAPSKDEEDNLKVVIDFDKDGKVVLKAIESLPSGQRQNGLLPLLQALYFPWLGFFFPSTAEGAKGGRAPIVAFAQALYFPWGAVFFPKLPQDDDDSVSITDTEDKDEDDENNNGVLPFIRALWFPWIGLFQGK